MVYKNITKTIYKVSDFITWQRSRSLVISPSFQRRPVWPKLSKSYLMDTIIRGFPVPIIFIRERNDLDLLEPKREIVDGQQRLRTIFAFIEPALLEDFLPDRDDFTISKTHYPEFAGYRFNDFGRDIQQHILNYEFSVHIFPSETEDQEVLQIFSRMNSTGVKLNKQELRNAEFIGSFKRLAYSIAYAQLNRWRKWNIFSETEIARMLEVEETSDLIIMMIDGIHGFNQKTIDKTYAKFEDIFPYEAEVKRRFERVMDMLDVKLGDRIRESPFSRKALFHTLFTFIYDLIYGLDAPLFEELKPKTIKNSLVLTFEEAAKKIEEGDLSEDLARVLRGGTGNLDSRIYRLEFLSEIINRDKS